MEKEAKGKIRVGERKAAMVLVAAQKCRPFDRLHLAAGPQMWARVSWSAQGVCPVVSPRFVTGRAVFSWEPAPGQGTRKSVPFLSGRWPPLCSLPGGPHEALALTGPTHALLKVEPGPGGPGQFSWWDCKGWTTELGLFDNMRYCTEIRDPESWTPKDFHLLFGIGETVKWRETPTATSTCRCKFSATLISLTKA